MEGYEANAITVCAPKKDNEWASEEGEEYWMLCRKGAYKLVAGITALATSAYMLAWAFDTFIWNIDLKSGTWNQIEKVKIWKLETIKYFQYIIDPMT